MKSKVREWNVHVRRERFENLFIIGTCYFYDVPFNIQINDEGNT